MPSLDDWYSIGNHDLLTAEGRDAARKEFDAVEPDLLVLQFPTEPWPPIHNWQKTKKERDQKRQQIQPILDFVRELADARDKAKTLFVVMNPSKSTAWSVEQMWLSNEEGAWKRGFWKTTEW